MKTALAIAAVLFAGALVISFVVGFSLGTSQAEGAGSPEVESVETVPTEDLPGENVPGVRRYPGAVRVDHLLGGVRIGEVGYLAEGRLSEANSIYEQKLGENGWSHEGDNLDVGERGLRANLGEQGVLVEIEMEFSEPISP